MPMDETVSLCQALYIRGNCLALNESYHAPKKCTLMSLENVSLKFSAIGSASSFSASQCKQNDIVRIKYGGVLAFAFVPICV